MLCRRTRETLSLGNKPAEPGDISFPSLRSGRSVPRVRVRTEADLEGLGDEGLTRQPDIQEGGAHVRLRWPPSVLLDACPWGEKEKNGATQTLSIWTLGCSHAFLGTCDLNPSGSAMASHPHEAFRHLAACHDGETRCPNLLPASLCLLPSVFINNASCHLSASVWIVSVIYSLPEVPIRHPGT